MDSILLIIQLITLIVMTFGIFYTAKQLAQSRKIHWENHEWNRRLASQNAMSASEDINRSIELHKKLNIDSVKESIPLKEIEKVFEEHKEISIYLSKLLNSYEGYARGIFQGLYDEEIIKNGKKSSMIRYFFLFKNYIDFKRKERNSETLWSEYERLIDKWKFEDTQKEQRKKLGSID